MNGRPTILAATILDRHVHHPIYTEGWVFFCTQLYAAGETPAMTDQEFLALRQSENPDLTLRIRPLHVERRRRA